MEELLLQHKTIKEIAIFLGVSESKVNRCLNRTTPTPKNNYNIAGYLDSGYEDRLLAQPSRGEWMKSKERRLEASR